MKKALGIAGAFLMLIVATVSAAGYNYVGPDRLKAWLVTEKKTVIVDIQVPDEFAKRHFTGSLETNAYPVKSDEERKRLDAAMGVINSSRDDVVIVCPRGGGGAKNARELRTTSEDSEKSNYFFEGAKEGHRWSTEG